MLSLTETVIGLMLLGFVLLQHSEIRYERLESERAAAAAQAVTELAGGFRDYLEDEYQNLEWCLRVVPDPVNPGDVVDARTIWTTGNETGAFMAIPLFQLPEQFGGEAYAPGALPGGVTRAQAVSVFGGYYADGCGYGAAEADLPLPVDFRRPYSVYRRGHLPAAFLGMQYGEIVGGVERLSGEVPAWSIRGIRFAAVVRLVNRNPVAGTPVLAVQGILVGSADGDVLNEVFAVTERVRDVGAGTLSSEVFGPTPAGRGVRGVGWEVDLCATTAAGAGVLTGSAAEPCRAGFAGASRLDVDADAAARGTGGLAESDLLQAFRPAGSVAVTLSGRSAADLALTPPTPRGRMVVFAEENALDHLDEVLYRVDVGIPELNRMATDLDMGTWGVRNVAYLGGIDSDSDGIVELGTQIVGPPAGSANPVTVWGDLLVTGALQVGRDAFVPAANDAGTISGGPAVAGGNENWIRFDGENLEVRFDNEVEFRSNVVEVTAEDRAEVSALAMNLDAAGAVEVVAADRLGMEAGANLRIRAGDEMLLATAGALGVEAPEVSLVAEDELVIAGGLPGGAAGRAVAVPARTDASGAGRMYFGNAGGIDVVSGTGQNLTVDGSRTLLRQAGNAAGTSTSRMRDRTLDAAIGRYTFGGFGDPLSLDPNAGFDCSAFFKNVGPTQNVGVVHGWAASGMTDVLNYEVVTNIQFTPETVVDGTVTSRRITVTYGDIPVPVPYSGWAASATTGWPEDIPGVTEQVRRTILGFCDWAP